MFLIGWCCLTQCAYAALHEKKEENFEKLTLNFADTTHTFEGDQLKRLLTHCKLFEKSKEQIVDLKSISFQPFTRFLLNIGADEKFMRMLLANQSAEELGKQLHICTNLRAEYLGNIILEIFANRFISDKVLEQFSQTGDIPAKNFSATQEKQIAHSILKILMPKIVPSVTVDKKSIAFSKISDIAFSQRGLRLAIAADKEIHILNPDTLEPFYKPLCCHKDTITMLAFNPSSEFELATSSCDSTIRLWDTLNGGQTRFEFNRHKAPVNTVSYTSETDQLISGDQKGTLFVWAPSKDSPDITFTDQDFNIRAAAYDPTAKKIIYGNLDGFKILKFVDGKPSLLSKIGTDISNIPDLCYAAKKLLMHIPPNNQISFKSECTEKLHAHHPHMEMKQETYAEKNELVIVDKQQIVPPLVHDAHKDLVKKMVYHPNGNLLASIDHKADTFVITDLSQVNELYKMKIGTNLSQTLLLAAIMSKKIDPKQMPQHFESTAAPLKNIFSLLAHEAKTAL